MNRLPQLGLNELRAAVSRHESCVPAVSAWSVGMHVHHCCLSMIGICRSLADATPPPPGGPSLLGRFLLLIGRIPRGRAQAGEAITPERGISPTDILARLGESEKALRDAGRLDPRAWIRHFVFGILTRDRALRFIAIHNRHHLRIVSEIVAAASRDFAPPRSRPGPE